MLLILISALLTAVVATGYILVPELEQQEHMLYWHSRKGDRNAALQLAAFKDPLPWMIYFLKKKLLHRVKRNHHPAHNTIAQSEIPKRTVGPDLKSNEYYTFFGIREKVDHAEHEHEYAEGKKKPAWEYVYGQYTTTESPLPPCNAKRCGGVITDDFEKREVSHHRTRRQQPDQVRRAYNPAKNRRKRHYDYASLRQEVMPESSEERKRIWYKDAVEFPNATDPYERWLMKSGSVEE